VLFEHLKTFALLILTFLSICAPAILAQDGADLEVSVMPSSPTARAGEHFTFKATVRNRGDAKAADVILLTNNFRSGEFVTTTPTKGTCEVERPRGENVTLRCKLADLEPGSEASVDVAVKFFDVDDEIPEAGSNREAALRSATNLMLSIGAGNVEPAADGSLIATVLVGAKAVEANEANNSADLTINLLPSRNVRPTVRVVSPQSSTMVVKRSSSPFRLTIRIEAVDSDGTVDKVTVRDPSNTPHPFVEDGQYKFMYMGRKYTAEELDQHMRTALSDEKFAIKTGPNIYEFVVTDVGYGTNRFHISAIDNGGRPGSTDWEVNVKGDAEVEIVSPRSNQIVVPGSDLIVETISKLNEGVAKELMLVQSGAFPASPTEVPRMTLVSKEGNIYRHRYVLKNVSAEVYANIRAVLIEESGAMSESPSIRFIVAKAPQISIVLDEGDTYAKDIPITIGFKSDADVRDIEYEIHIDGKSRTRIFTQFIWHDAKPGKHIVEIVAKVSDVELARSKPKTIVIR